MHYLEKELLEKVKSDSQFFNFLREGTLDGMWYWDLENPEREFMDSKFWLTLGYNPKEKKHESAEWQDIINKDDLEVATENFKKHAEDPNHPYDQIVRYRHKNGSTVWIRCRGLIIRDEEGKPVRMIGAHNDITKLKELEFYHELEEKYEKLFMNAPIGYIVVDKYLEIKKINLAGSELLNCKESNSLEEVICSCENKECRCVREEFIRYVEECFKSEKTLTTSLDICLHKKIKKTIKMTSSVFVENYIKYLQIALIDETKEQNYLDYIKNLSITDRLTDIYNRRFFEEELIRVDKKENYPIGIIMADLNGLKLVNDTYSHRDGDELLKLAVKHIQNNCRKMTLARLGGDEFGILIKNINKEDLQKVYERLVNNLKGIRHKEIELSITFGKALKENESQDIEDVLKEADEDMYRNKLMTSSSHKLSIVELLLATFHKKYKKEEEHSYRVAEYLEKFGRVLKLENTQIEFLKAAGIFHDIGKVTIDYSIFEKEGPLTKEEKNKYRKHVENSYKILSQSSVFSYISDVVLSHHERIDGRGYPRGLKGDEISLEAKMLAICDTYDKMKNFKGMSYDFLIEEMKFASGTQLDKKLVDIFIKKIIMKEKIF